MLFVTAMTIGSQQLRRASAIRHQNSTEGVLLLPPKRCLTQNSLQGDNFVFVDEPPDMTYNTECFLVRNDHGPNTSIVMERSKTIGAKVS